MLVKSVSLCTLLGATAISASQSFFSKSQDDIIETLKYSAEDKDLLRLHKHLIEAESTSQVHEANAVDVLTKYFSSIDWDYQLLPTFGNADRSNIFAWPGRSNATCKLLVSSHIDTVPPYIPYTIHNGSIYGRGSADAKASVATQIEAIRRLLRKDMIKADEVAVLYVVGRGPVEVITRQS